MSLPKEDAAALAARWTGGVLLKRDVFSTVERGRFRSDAGEVDAVLRRLDEVPWWSAPLARHLFTRERRALALARDLDVGPKLLWAGRRALARGLFNFTDREGGGRRLVNDAPVLVALIRKNPDVRDAAIVAFADRRSGVGLYAFVEADQVTLEKQLREALSAARGIKPPEHIQVVHALPRDAAGKPRTEILQLVAMNQLDLIEPMMRNDADRAFLSDILESRKNLRDRVNFETAELNSPSR